MKRVHVHQDRKCVAIAVLAGLLAALVVSASANSPIPKQKPPDLVTVRGTVVTVDGRPLEGVNGSTEGGPCWVSGKGGKFVIKLKPGTYKLWALAAKSRAVTLVVPKGKSSVSVRVIAKRMKNRVPLKFLTPGGRPAANARMASGMRAGSGTWGMGPVSTDARGILMEQVEYDAPVWFFSAASGIGYAKLEIADDETLFSEEPILVQLSSGPYVSGRVVAERGGMPLGGVNIYPWRVYKKGDPWSGWNSQFGFKSYQYTINEVMSATSRDGDGTFRLGPLPPGDYKMDYGAPEVGDLPADEGRNLNIAVASIPVNVPEDRDIEGLQIVYPVKKPAYSLMGQVFQGDTSTPLASTEITISVMTIYPPDPEPENWYVCEPVVRTVVTDAQGNYRLYPIRPGKYKLEAKWEKFSATRNVSLRANATGVDFTLH
ncbi:MAG TPA: carboxypeptidase-like regulatory domain-containing protein [Armatimonadota bacterium]|nr:carboxypeptidase-like regulatory domain-containing protein [Armatimonadota bacterium]